MQTKDRWRESLKPRIAAARALLAERLEEEIVRCAGLTQCGDHVELAFLGRTIRLNIPGFVAYTADGNVCPEETQILLLDYITRSRGAKPSGRFLGFRELPGGAFYDKAFRGYTSEVLIRELDGNAVAFRRAAVELGGESIDDLGDIAFTFRALPGVAVAIVWWHGDEEFPATASVLFDEGAREALPIDGFAAIGRILCNELLRSAHQENENRTMEKPQGRENNCVEPSEAR